MNWLIAAQPAPLADWIGRPLSPGIEFGPGPGDARDAYERVVAQEEPGPPLPDGVYRQLADALFAFDVFNPHWVTPVLLRHRVQLDDVVGVRYHFVPGLDLFFAARVSACFDADDESFWRTGFTYRTLTGHPKVGEETFSVEKELATGRIRVAVRSWSRPGSWLTRFGDPLVRRWQRQAGQGALDHLQSIADRHVSLVEKMTI